jgi:hypothetical protein
MAANLFSIFMANGWRLEMKPIRVLLAAVLLLVSPYLFADPPGGGVDKKSESAIPFQTGFACEAYGIPSCSGIADIEIPEGMRFVIQYVSARILVTKGNGLEVTLWAGDPVNTVRSFRVPAHYSGDTVTGTTSIHTVSEQVLVFVEPNEDVPDINVSVYSTYPEVDPRISVQQGLITGYLVPIE